MSTSLAVRLNNLWWERRLRVSTRGLVPPPDHPDSARYSTMSYSSVLSVLEILDLRPSDVFVDIGSGKGRMLCLAARQPIKEAIGVELQPELCAEARANAEHMRGRRAPITVEQKAAEQFDYTAATVIFLFDPFGESTLRQVLAKIAEDTRGHEVRFAYANPTRDAVYQEQQWLTGRDYRTRADTGWEHDVVFYRSIG